MKEARKEVLGGEDKLDVRRSPQFGIKSFLRQNLHS